MLNFQIRQFRRVDGGWGSIDAETGLWNGLISNQGYLLRGTENYSGTDRSVAQVH